MSSAFYIAILNGTCSLRENGDKICKQSAVKIHSKLTNELDRQVSIMLGQGVTNCVAPTFFSNGLHESVRAGQKCVVTTMLSVVLPTTE